ncbi:MAG: hypothetical protein AB7H70_13515 [Rhodospirillaceae bacterium]
MNAVPPQDSNNADSRAKAKRRRVVLFACLLALVPLFMYVSFIVKTAVRGP